MQDKLAAVEARYSQIEAQLAANETYSDPDLVSRLNKEQRELEPLVTAYRVWLRRRADLEGAQALMSDPEVRELAQEEYNQARETWNGWRSRLRCFFCPGTQTTGRTLS